MRRNLKRWDKKAKANYDVAFINYDEICSIEKSMDIFFSLFSLLSTHSTVVYGQNFPCQGGISGNMPFSTTVETWCFGEIRIW